MANSHDNHTKKVDKQMTKKTKAGGFLLGAALGAAVGAAAGILTAPKAGKETRADIARASKKAAQKAKAQGKKVIAGAEREFRKVTGGRNPKKKATRARK